MSLQEAAATAPPLLEVRGLRMHFPVTEGMIARRQFQHCIGADLVPRLIDPLTAAANQPGEDQRLRLGSTLRQALVDEELIGSPL